MLEKIFVAIMCIFALGAGIWTWWYENYKPEDVESTEDVEESMENEEKKEVIKL